MTDLTKDKIEEEKATYYIVKNLEAQYSIWQL